MCQISTFKQGIRSCLLIIFYYIYGNIYVYYHYELKQQSKFNFNVKLYCMVSTFKNGFMYVSIIRNTYSSVIFKDEIMHCTEH
jgi:hypothetical protein